MMQVLLSQLKPMELNKYLNSLQENEKFEIFSNPKNVLELNDSVFLMAFQQLSSEIKQKLLTDKRIAKRILEKSASARIKSPIDYLSEEEKTILLKHTDLLIQMGESILEKILERKESLELKELTAGISTALKENKVPEQNKKLLRIQQLIKNEATVAELKTIWNFKETDLQSLITLSTQSKRNPLVLLKIKTEDEFIFYLKTGCVISKKEIESLQIPIELIEKLNMKSLSKLVAIYQEHLNNNHYNLSDEKVLITVLNTYLVFGYDNARKILLDFFTYPTESSKIKQADIEFREARKEYRLTHQNEFYSHILAKEVYQELMDIMSGETEAENSHTFQMVLQSKDKEKCEMFYQELMAILRQKRTNLEETISDFLKEKIKTREEEKKNIYIQENKEKNIVKPNENTLYSLFKGLDYNKIKLDENGNPIINKKLTTLFLGNEKRKNDCLLRMIISKNIFGAKDHVIAIINNFSLIEAEINRSNGLLSLNSLSDVMKVYQVTCFSLDYDEEDISLSTIAKINKSKEFVENSEIDIVKNKINELELSVKQKEEFITNFTHELKNPMTSIIGYADILRSGKYDKETNIKSANYIFHEAKRLETLAHKLMDLMELSNENIELEKIDVVCFMNNLYNDIHESLENIELIFSQNEKNRAVLEEVNKMKSDDKEIFIAYYYDEKRVKEISIMLNISESKVKSRLFRIRKKLKKVLKEREV